jgi:hypothetical protein
MTKSLRRVAGVARSATAVGALLALGGASVGAQHGPPSRVFDRLFAPEESGAGNLTVAVMQGMDSQSGNAPEALHSPIPLGAFLGINPSASLGSEDFSLGGGGILRRYTDTGTFRVYDAHGGASARFTGRRVAGRVSGAVTYAPFSQFLAISGVPSIAGAAPERAGYDRPVTTFVSSFDVGRQLARKVMLSGGYRWQYHHLAPTTDPFDTLADTQMHDLSARLSRQMSRTTILFAGYGTRISTEQAQAVRPLRAHDINIGVDRSQQLKFSRRTTLQFSTGSSIVEVPEGYRFFAIGSAALRHEISRTWAAGVSARRGIGYLEGLRDPVFSQSLALSLGGPIGNRVDAMAEGGYSTGDIGLSAASSGFHAYSGSMRVRALLTRRLAAYGEWVVYEQRFDGRADLPGLFSPSLNRQGFRAGLMMNVPLQSERPGQRGAR